MSRSPADRTLALAGIFQAAELVDATARQGVCDPRARAATLNSLFAFDAPDTVSVFGGLDGIRLGLRALVQQLESGADNAVLRYTMVLLTLSRRANSGPLLREIADGLNQAAELRKLHGFDGTAVLDATATTYMNTVSKLQPRVIVRGEPEHLKQATTAALIRSLLLAGVRAGILWRQSGGSRAYLLFSRKRLIFEANKLLNEAE